jgi:hypothetical protein
MGTAEEISGWVVLDVPSTEGTLVFEYPNFGAIEFSIGAKGPNA